MTVFASSRFPLSKVTPVAAPPATSTRATRSPSMSSPPLDLSAPTMAFTIVSAPPRPITMPKLWLTMHSR